jgi:hypothetical protein
MIAITGKSREKQIQVAASQQSTDPFGGTTSYNPRLALHSSTMPTAWKMKFGSHTIR